MKPRTIRIIYWIVTILFAIFMLFDGFTELAQTQQAQDLLAFLGYPLYVNFIIGAAKILGVIAILQTKFKTIKEWAYAGFTIDISGAMLSFLLLKGDVISVLFILPFLLVLFISYFLWKRVEKL